MKDHQVALLIHELTAIARESSQDANLRHRISKAVHDALFPVGGPTQAGTDEEERRLFATHMEAQGFGREAVAPPKPGMKHYRSSHVETCWETWAGCIKAHGLLQPTPQAGGKTALYADEGEA